MAADRRLLPDRGLLTARLTLLPLLALIIHPPPQYLLETISFSYGQIGRGGIGPQLFEVLIILRPGGSQKIKARFFAISEAISESCLSHQKLMFFFGAVTARLTPLPTWIYYSPPQLPTTTTTKTTLFPFQHGNEENEDVEH